MNDYTVTMVYDQFNITTVVYAENEEEAQMITMQKMTQDEGLKIGYPVDWDIVLEGRFI